MANDILSNGVKRSNSLDRLVHKIIYIFLFFYNSLQYPKYYRNIPKYSFYPPSDCRQTGEAWPFSPEVSIPSLLSKINSARACRHHPPAVHCITAVVQPYVQRTYLPAQISQSSERLPVYTVSSMW